MTAHELEVFNPTNSTQTNEIEEEYSIPLCIDDIINICKEYTKLTWQMQSHIETILEMGVEEAINTGLVPRISLPHIKDFLLRICDNSYFGDAVSQSYDCIELIRQYEEIHKMDKVSNLN